MIEDLEGNPITYINKGQAYTITVLDSAPSRPELQVLKHRTYIRISFEDQSSVQNLLPIGGYGNGDGVAIGPILARSPITSHAVSSDTHRPSQPTA